MRSNQLNYQPILEAFDLASLQMLFMVSQPKNFIWFPRQESNLYHSIRSATFYPLNYKEIYVIMVPTTGLEPVTHGFEDRSSIQLKYVGVYMLYGGTVGT